MAGRNRAGVVGLEFDIGDVPMLMEALSLASATAMMYGPAGSGSRKRLRDLSEELAAMSPIPRGNRSEAYRWRDACSAMATATSYSIRSVRQRDGYRASVQHAVHVVVDGAVYPVAHDLAPEEADAVAARVTEALQSVAGMDTELRSSVTYAMAIREGLWEDRDRVAEVLSVLGGMVDGAADRLAVLSVVPHYRRTGEGMDLVSATVEAPRSLHEAIGSLLDGNVGAPPRPGP